VETGASIQPSGPALARTLGGRVRYMLGLRRTIRAGPVRYRERTAEPLRHALSRKGSGAKQYDAHFEDGPPLRIHATARRVYADLAGPRLLPHFRSASEWLMPGMRVLLLEGGTGYAAEWVAARVGPSGAVVSLDRDEESTAFARRRYPLPNVAYEVGGLETLSGETDGGFAAVFAVDALDRSSDPASPLAELWRVVAEEGWLLVAAPTEGGSVAAKSEAERLAGILSVAAQRRPGGEPETLQESLRIRPPELAAHARDGWAVLIARRPAQE
jgi:ubiquinone/menaquinone biosynthesis C-methylase UbiE